MVKGVIVGACNLFLHLRTIIKMITLRAKVFGIGVAALC